MGDYNFPNLPAQTAFPISKIGYPFIFAFAFITAVFALLNFSFMTLLFLFLTLFACFFFRDPDRLIPLNPLVVVSPADGRIVDVSTVDDNSYFEGGCYKISIFMSIFNVHVNRVPFGGVVKHVDYHPGKRISANLNKSSTDNERNTIVLKTNEGFIISFVQIAGLIARRIVCGVQAGNLLKKGERFGLICFGSRLDVYLPFNINISVKKGDSVKAGSSVIGELSNVN